MTLSTRLLVLLPLARSLSADFPTGFSRVVVASGTSCYANTVGPALVRDWIEAGVDVTLLTRKVDIARAPLPVGNQYGHLAIGPSLVARTRFRRWDAGNPGACAVGDFLGWEEVLEGADAVVHLTREVSGSTELEVAALARAIGACASRPKALVTLAPADGVVADDGFAGKRRARVAAAEAEAAAAADAAGGAWSTYAMRLAGVVGADWYGGQYGLIGGANCPWIHRADLARCVAHVASGGARFSTADAPLVVGLGGGARAPDTAAAAEGAAKLASSNFEFAYRELEDAKNDARTAPAVWA